VTDPAHRHESRADAKDKARAALVFRRFCRREIDTADTTLAGPRVQFELVRRSGVRSSSSTTCDAAMSSEARIDIVRGMLADGQVGMAKTSWDTRS
jgi:hypothetical protein